MFVNDSIFLAISVFNIAETADRAQQRDIHANAIVESAPEGRVVPLDIDRISLSCDTSNYKWYRATIIRVYKTQRNQYNHQLIYPTIPATT